MQKDKVWSCSEYDSFIAEVCALETVHKPQKNLNKKLELV